MKEKNSLAGRWLTKVLVVCPRLEHFDKSTVSLTVAGEQFQLLQFNCFCDLLSTCVVSVHSTTKLQQATQSWVLTSKETACVDNRNSTKTRKQWAFVVEWAALWMETLRILNWTKTLSFFFFRSPHYLYITIWTRTRNRYLYRMLEIAAMKQTHDWKLNVNIILVTERMSHRTKNQELEYL